MSRMLQLVLWLELQQLLLHRQLAPESWPHLLLVPEEFFRNDSNKSHQEPITWSLHMCCALESTHSRRELFLEQAFTRN